MPQAITVTNAYQIYAHNVEELGSQRSSCTGGIKGAQQLQDILPMVFQLQKCTALDVCVAPIMPPFEFRPQCTHVTDDVQLLTKRIGP